MLNQSYDLKPTVAEYTGALPRSLYAAAFFTDTRFEHYTSDIVEVANVLFLVHNRAPPRCSSCKNLGLHVSNCTPVWKMNSGGAKSGSTSHTKHALFVSRITPVPEYRGSFV